MAALGSVWIPTSFWSQVWHGAEERYNMIEKQLLVTYSPLQVVESITDNRGNSENNTAYSGMGERSGP